jgi:hypothetical protein
VRTFSLWSKMGLMVVPSFPDLHMPQNSDAQGCQHESACLRVVVLSAVHKKWCAAAYPVMVVAFWLAVSAALSAAAVDFSMPISI